MREPLVALLVAPDQDMRESILCGEKSITIREGLRNYRAGQSVMLCCHLSPWAVMADIASVRHCYLREVTLEECEADGAKDWNELASRLKKYYPQLNEKSEITVIRWTNIRGELVDQYRVLTSPIE